LGTTALPLAMPTVFVQLFIVIGIFAFYS